MTALRTVKILVVLAALAAVALTAMYVYAGSKSEEIASGITIEGVEVGGLNSTEAIRKVSRQLDLEYRRSLKVQYNSKTFKITPDQVDLRLDVKTAVDKALERSKNGSFVKRSLRDIRKKRIEESYQVQPKLAQAEVKAQVDLIAKELNRPASDASVQFSSVGISVKESKDGEAIDSESLSWKIRNRLLTPSSKPVIQIKTAKVKPKVKTDDLPGLYPTVLIVDRGSSRLRFFKDLKLSKTYEVSVGTKEFPTPLGTFRIQSQQKNPVWHVPDAEWAGDYRGKTIKPGKRNPLKSRWMGFSGSVGFHGTASVDEIGGPASHGCVRMRVPDIKDLYEQVHVGETIVHVSA